jgi:anthranilate synthase component 1
VIRPTLDEFRTLARTHTVIPVWRELLADLTTPVAAYARLVGDGTGFLDAQAVSDPGRGGCGGMRAR